MAETRLSVHVYNSLQHQTVQFLKLCLKVQRSWADLQLYDSELQTEGALTLNAFADSASDIRRTVSNNLSDDRNVRAGR